MSSTVKIQKVEEWLDFENNFLMLCEAKKIINMDEKFSLYLECLKHQRNHTYYLIYDYHNYLLTLFIDNFEKLRLYVMKYWEEKNDVRYHEPSNLYYPSSLFPNEI